MLKRWSKLCLITGCLSLTALVAFGQEIVHALSGTVSSISPVEKTITIRTDDGSEGIFKEMKSSRIPLEFDEHIRAHTIPAGEFKNVGDRVIVYYFGGGFGEFDERTAVALQDLGAKPLEASEGTVRNFDRHQHLLTITSSSGAKESFHIDGATTAETSDGAVEGEKYDPEKGDQVRVLSKQMNGNGNSMAVYIRES